jgi:hypothetical protein
MDQNIAQKHGEKVAHPVDGRVMGVRFYLVILILPFLSACALMGGSVKRSPVQTLPQMTLPAGTAISTLLPETPTPGVTPSKMSPALTAADFPLAAGAIWTYSAEISYQDPNGDLGQLVTWTGTVTQTITGEETQPDGSVVYTVQEEMQPAPPQQVWRQPHSFTYATAGDQVLKEGSPLFLQVEGPGARSFATFVGSVETPYGVVDGCYALAQVTNPDRVIETFCPGVGFVKYEYHHNGAAQDERLLLLSFQPGK